MSIALRTRDLEEMLFGTGPRRHVMVVIRGSFDASMDSPAGVTAIAGYMGSSACWGLVEEKWNALCGVYKIDRFRLTEIIRRFGLQGGIEIAQQFGRIIGKSDLRFASAHMLDTDWAQLEKHPEYQEVYPERQHACLELLLGLIAEEAEYEYKDQPLALVFDNDYGNIERSARVYDAWRKRTGHPGFASVSWIRGEAEWDVVPLQAADMLAGLVRRSPIQRSSLKTLQHHDPKIKLEPFDLAWLAASTKGRGTHWSIAVAEELREILRKRNEGEPE